MHPPKLPAPAHPSSLAPALPCLRRSDSHIELQVPPDCGNGKDNSGIPLARLLYHVPPAGMLTLVASLLLERRIVFVARSRDTVTAAVQAAQALIYPFRCAARAPPAQHQPLLPFFTFYLYLLPLPFTFFAPSHARPPRSTSPLQAPSHAAHGSQGVYPPRSTSPFYLFYLLPLPFTFTFYLFCTQPRGARLSGTRVAPGS